jgi:hypothetical protein
MPLGKRFEWSTEIAPDATGPAMLRVTGLGVFSWPMYLVAAVLVSSCGLVPESSFELSNESRLPKWMVPRSGEARTALTVTMDYRGNALGRWEGSLQGNEPRQLSKPPAGFPPGYPSYEIVRVGVFTEIVEHRKMEPVFYITDSSIVWEELVGHR